MVGSGSQYRLRPAENGRFLDVHISITRRGTSENSSDLDRGRRPKLKSDEFSEVPLLFIEIISILCEISGRFCYRYWVWWWSTYGALSPTLLPRLIPQMVLPHGHSPVHTSMHSLMHTPELFWNTYMGIHRDLQTQVIVDE